MIQISQTHIWIPTEIEAHGCMSVFVCETPSQLHPPNHSFHAASHSQYQRPLIGESPRLRPVRVPRAPSPLISPFVRNTGPSLRPQGGSNTKQIRKTYADIPETNPPTSRCYVLSSTPSYQDKLSALPKCPLLTNPVCPNPGPNLADAAL